MFNHFIFRIFSPLAKRAIVRQSPKIIGVFNQNPADATAKTIFRVLSGQTESISKNIPGMDRGNEIIFAILGYRRRMPGFIRIFFLFGAYLRSLKKTFPKYLILDLRVEDERDFVELQSYLKLDIAIIAGKIPFKIEQLSDIINNDGLIIINGDLDFSTDFARQRNVITVGIDKENASYWAENIRKEKGLTEYRIVTTGQKISVSISKDAKESIYSGLFAFAVGQHFNIQSLKIKKSLEEI